MQDTLQQPRLVLHLATMHNSLWCGCSRDSGETLQARFIQNISGSPGVQTFVSSTAEGSGHGSVSMLSQVTPSAVPGTVRVSPFKLRSKNELSKFISLFAVFSVFAMSGYKSSYTSLFSERLMKLPLLQPELCKNSDMYQSFVTTV